MDVLVYTKEEVLQPYGTGYVYVPDVIDIKPTVETDDEGNETVTGCEELDDDSTDLLEQKCALATIFQMGLDPIDKYEGIQWSEALLGEVSVFALMEQITSAIADVTTSVTVIFDTATNDDGTSYLTYTLQEVA